MKQYVIFAILLNVIILPVFAEDDFNIKLDKSMYFLRDTIIINGNLDKVDPDEDKIKFEIVNPYGIIVDRFYIERDEDDALDFTHSISIIKNIWNEEGLYRLRASYADSFDTAYFHVFQSKTGLERHIDSTIGLDKEIYSWTDKVEIFVVAPSFNYDNDMIERIGTGSELRGTITIETSKGTLNEYKLQETDIDSGIFFGTVILTGDELHDANDDGIKRNDATGFTGGKGSDKGEIAARGSDEIKVIFENEEEEIESSSKISWMLAEFENIPTQIEDLENIEIRLHEKDINFKNDFLDRLYILAWSDSNPNSKKIELHETRKNSGVFEGIVKLSSEGDGLTTIKAENPDVLHIKYADMTVPFEISESKSQDVVVDIQIGQIETEKELVPQIEIPTWIHNNAKWYAEGTIGEADFTQGIGYMIKNDIMKIPELPERAEGQVTSKVPDWVKNNAKWWSDGQISDGDFVKGIQYLVKQGIIQVHDQ